MNSRDQQITEVVIMAKRSFESELSWYCNNKSILIDRRALTPSVLQALMLLTHFMSFKPLTHPAVGSADHGHAQGHGEYRWGRYITKTSRLTRGNLRGGDTTTSQLLRRATGRRHKSSHGPRIRILVNRLFGILFSSRLPCLTLTLSPTHD